MRVLIDVFPALVRIAPPGSLSDITSFGVRGDAPQQTRRLDRCRVAVVDTMIRIAVDSPEGPSLVFQEQISERQSKNKTHWVVTESGKILVFEKDNNCGCGSRLRNWNPFGNSISSSEDPQ
jgi:hypothetical protein